MGADAPMPPITIPAAAPKGAPRRLQLPIFPSRKLPRRIIWEALIREVLEKIPRAAFFIVRV